MTFKLRDSATIQRLYVPQESHVSQAWALLGGGMIFRRQSVWREGSCRGCELKPFSMSSLAHLNTGAQTLRISTGNPPITDLG